MNKASSFLWVVLLNLLTFQLSEGFGGINTAGYDQCCSPTGSGCHPYPCAEAYGIPRGNTVRRGSECGVEPPNYPSLAECDVPLSKNMDVSNIRPFSDPNLGNLTFLPDVYDARGHWSTADGSFQEYLEQCGVRNTTTLLITYDTTYYLSLISAVYILCRTVSRKHKR